MNIPLSVELIELFRSSESILFITGAGLSADSGLPTYRGVGGLYNRNDTEDGIPIETALSGSMFQENPQLTWKYLWEIGEACSGAEPNAMHHFIARLEQEKPCVWTMTQNVDGLHRMAGSRNLVEVHGHAYDLFCTDCGKDYAAEELFGRYDRIVDLPPVCEHCKGIIRPDVVLFGEMLSQKTIQYFSELAEMDFQLLVAIGTSAQFPYISEPVETANALGVPTVEINPDKSPISSIVNHQVRLGASVAADLISKAIWGEA